MVNRLAEFGRDLFSGSSNDEEHKTLTNKQIYAKNYFEKLQSSKQGRSKIYKEILARGYV